MPSSPTFPDFAVAFLARFVKPSDSAKARAELPNLKQTSTVEASFASWPVTVTHRAQVRCMTAHSNHHTLDSMDQLTKAATEAIANTYQWLQDRFSEWNGSISVDEEVELSYNQGSST